MTDTAAGPCTVLEERLRLRERQFAAVTSVAQALQSLTDLSDLLCHAVRAAMAVADADAGSLLLHDADRRKLIFRHVEGPTKATVTGMEIDDGQGIAGEVLHTGRPRISHDMAAERAHLVDIERAADYHTTSMVSLPLRAYTGEIIGVLQVLNKRDGAFCEDDLAVLEVLGMQAASAIVTAQLHERARAAAVVDHLGQLSHDIKNLLTPVSLAGQTLRSMLDDFHLEMDAQLTRHADGAREMVPVLRDILRHVAGEVGEVFDILDESTQIAQQRAKEIADSVKGLSAPPVYEPANLDEIVTGVCRVLAMVAEQHGVMLTTELHAGQEALLDAKRIYNAVYNLTHNAIGATPRGGRVIVRATVGGSDCFPDGGHLRLQVQDTGCGMTPEVAVALFTTGVRSTKAGGTGLGSRVVKNVIEAHGGCLSVVSVPGQGTTITARVPLRLANSE